MLNIIIHVSHQLHIQCILNFVEEVIPVVHVFVSFDLVGEEIAILHIVVPIDKEEELKGTWESGKMLQNRGRVDDKYIYVLGGHLPVLQFRLK